MKKKLSDFTVGESGRVLLVEAASDKPETVKIRRRLFDMGVTPGADLYLKKKAPLGDPMEVTLRGYELTLRKNEADCIVMEVK